MSTTFRMYLIAVLGFACLSAAGQRQPAATPINAPAANRTAIKTGDLDLRLPPDTMVSTQHQLTVNGQRISYTATAGTQPVWDDGGKAIASLFYVYFSRNDLKDKSNRPIVFSFNGGPGTSSVWMNIGFTGPKKLKISDEGHPIQPFGVEDNPYSIIDVADIVFVDPVNTGFSRILDPATDRSRFFGVNADVQYLSSWISSFLSRKSRWESPKFLIGESYGTTRVAGLASRLQSAEWAYFNGVILVSPTDLGISRQGPVKDASMLPYYAATAWYHKQLPADLQRKDLMEILPEVEKFTLDEYIPALSRGGNIEDAERTRIAAAVARYSGISQTLVQQNNLVIRPNFFWKELLRDSGYTVGRLDSRYLGQDHMDAGISPDYNAELTAWLQAFTPAINSYLRDDLGFTSDLKYYMFGPVHPWNNDNNRTGMQLRDAMNSNPALRLLVMSGYYDGATDYFNAKYNSWQMDAGGKLKDRMEFEGYRSGHMMYLRKEDLRSSNEAVRQFILRSIPAQGKEIRY